MTFGLFALVLSAAVSGSAPVCPAGKGLCNCISSLDGVVLAKATYKLLDLPADCEAVWLTKPSSKSIEEVANENPNMKLVKGENAGDADQVCRVKFTLDNTVKYFDPTAPNGGSYAGEPEYHSSCDSCDTHNGKWYLGRVYHTDRGCHFGTWSVHLPTETDGEEFFAPSFDLLAVPSSCEPSWKDPDQVSGRIPTQDEIASGAMAFCERSAVCAVEDDNGKWHPGYAIGAHRDNACAAFCPSGASGDCTGVCSGCNGCLVAGARIGEGQAEGGCGTGSGTNPPEAAPGSDDDALDASQVQDSSALAASVCLLVGLFAA